MPASSHSGIAPSGDGDLTLDTTQDDPSTSLNNIDSDAALWDRFSEDSQQTDLDSDEAIIISFFRRSFKRIPSDPANLFNLASALSIRFNRTGQQADIDEAISLLRQGLELHLSSHPEQSIRNLASALSIRFSRTGQQADIDEAISLCRQDPKLHLPSHPEPIRNLASALSTRFERTGQQADIDEAISLHRQDLKLLLISDPERPTTLSNLALALSSRFRHTGQNIDIDEAISLHRQAVVLDSSNSLHSCQPMTIGLAHALRMRFGRGGQQVDIDEAIYLFRQILETDPNCSMFVHSLATALSKRFQRIGQETDIDEAISLYRQNLTPLSWSDPMSSTYFKSFATSLLTRFQWAGAAGQKTDLDEGISIYRQLFKPFASDPHHHKHNLFHNLALALAIRFEQEGQQSDFDEAFSLFKQARDLKISLDDTSLPYSLTALGELCIDAHSRSTENSEYLEQAMSFFSASAECPSQSAFDRLRFAKIWIDHADRQGHTLVFSAYEAALQALPQVAALNLDIQSRQEALTTSDGLARDAARCAIRDGNLEKAIEFLEGGRSVFWSQVLSLRSPINKLHDIAPELADKLQDIGTALELGSHRDISREISDYRRNLSLDEESSRLNRLNEEWAISIHEVRKLEGFEDFLQPRRLSELRAAASPSPVVILVENRDGSHCLILTSSTIHHIDLPCLHTPMLQNLVRLVQVGVSKSRVSRSSINTIVEDMNALLGENRGTRVVDNKLGSSDDVFKLVLGKLWDDLVNPVIRLLKIQKSKSGELPVLKWCPTGLFNFLPIHAAGRYNDELSDECASDYFTSSYTPTIGALLLHNSPASMDTFKMMVVIHSELPSAKTELKVIERHVSSDTLIKVGVAGRPAEVEAVASILPSASIVHFACHGTQDRSKPLDSGLKLDDGVLRISRIMKETITNKSLVFLCACETAMGDKNLPDEAMNLGASLLFSGFHRVIATMWKMMDKDGPTIADGFYEEIFRGPDGKPSLVPDITRSAQALHLSVKKLRSQNVSFKRWVPFIHMG